MRSEMAAKKRKLSDAKNRRSKPAKQTKPRKQTKPVKRAKPTKSAKSTASAKPKLLSGGNPQIPKGEGDAPVRAFIDAMQGWHQGVGRRLDALIVRHVPGVRKAVRWNSPFYGIEGRGWFLSFHCFTKYVKVTFLRGMALRPLPPGESKHPHVRYLDIREDEEFEDSIFVSWIKQAAKLPGDPLF